MSASTLLGSLDDSSLAGTAIMAAREVAMVIQVSIPESKSFVTTGKPLSGQAFSHRALVAKPGATQGPVEQ
jgi:hypothetical protein